MGLKTSRKAQRVKASMMIWDLHSRGEQTPASCPLASERMAHVHTLTAMHTSTVLCTQQNNTCPKLASKLFLIKNIILVLSIPMDLSVDRTKANDLTQKPLPC